MAYDVEHAFRSAIFQVVSILTTTGFGNDNFSIWGTLSVSLILVLYFIGGSGGSTSGGMKIARILYLFKNAKEELKKTLLPHYVANIKVDKMRVKKTTIEHLSTFFFLYLAFFVLVTLIMSTVSGIDLETAFSSSIACLGNIGPGIGAVNQSSNYAFFSTLCQGCSCFCNGRWSSRSLYHYGFIYSSFLEKKIRNKFNLIISFFKTV